MSAISTGTGKGAKHLHKVSNVGLKKAKFVEESCIIDDKVPEKYEKYFCDSVTEFANDGYPTKGSQTTCDPSFSHIGDSTFDEKRTEEKQTLFLP